MSEILILPLTTEDVQVVRLALKMLEKAARDKPEQRYEATVQAIIDRLDGTYD